MSINFEDNLENVLSIDVCWLTAEKDGQTYNVFSLPRLKAERILLLVSLDYQNIKEIFNDTSLKLLNT